MTDGLASEIVLRRDQWWVPVEFLFLVKERKGQMYWSVLGQNWLWIVRLVKSWHFICNIGILSELVNFREIGICIGPRSTDLMFDMCWIDLEVFPGKRHIFPVELCRIDMRCVDGDSLVMMRKRPLIGMHLSQIGIGLSIGGLVMDW